MAHASPSRVSIHTHTNTHTHTHTPVFSAAACMAAPVSSFSFLRHYSTYYICVLVLLYIFVLMLLHVCPHTTICVLILLYVSSYYSTCVRTTQYVHSDPRRLLQPASPAAAGRKCQRRRHSGQRESARARARESESESESESKRTRAREREQDIKKEREVRSRPGTEMKENNAH
jgi:hypothetical protein